jgi:hypothetical protein
MTSGTKVDGVPNSFGSYTQKTWSGGDGKYESDGRDKWNDYSMDLSIVSDQLGQQTYLLGIDCFTVGPFIWTAKDEFRLQSKLVDAIKGHQFNLAVDLAQANQLVTMCAKTIRMFGRSALYLKRGNVAAALRELGVDGRNKKLKSKDVSGRWLEIQYGWLPALSSCYEAGKAFEALSLDRSGRVEVKSTRWDSGDASCFPDPSFGYTAPSNCFVKSKITCELNEEVSFARSLGLQDPLSVAWELTPFSFVFDWFLPVGAYLQNLAVIPSLQGRFMTSVYQGAFSQVGTTSNPGFIGTKRKLSIYRVRRTVTSGLTTQLPTFVDPVKAMTWNRIYNAVSLAHQLFT